VLEHEDVEEILRLLDATPLRWFELETDRYKITLRRGASGDWTQEYEAPRGARNSAAAKANADMEPPPPARTPSPVQTLVSGDAKEIRAPLIGTFYRSPKPGAAPFVEPGSLVRADTVVAIVETMKLMTSIYAGQSGRITEILIDDGQFVEQDQVLMRIAVGAP
jgi:acetyl-CoA carboxylase biotin carboxyl carrier protein